MSEEQKYLLKFRGPPPEEVHVWAIEYDGRFQVSYEMSNETGSAFRVEKAFAAALCQALAKSEDWQRQ